MGKITFNNYADNTMALFKGCRIPRRPPDYTSKSGSKYWYGQNMRGKYVIRSSNHWTQIRELNIQKLDISYIFPQCSNIASCQWAIKTNRLAIHGEILTGKCYLKQFKRIKR